MKKAIFESWPYTLIFIICIYMLGANPFAGQTLAPMDILVNQVGWKHTDISLPVHHNERSDILDARLPSWVQAKRYLREAELPLWNSISTNGTPGIQFLPNSIFTPSFVLFALTEDDAIGFYLAMLVNLVIVSIGTYLLLYHLFKNRLAAILGSTVFSFCGFHAAWFYWAHVTTSIWIPWLLLFVSRYLKDDDDRYLPWVAVVTALMIFGGFPIVVIYAFIAVGIFVLIQFFWAESIKAAAKKLTLLISFMLLGFCLSLFAVYSLYEMLDFTKAISFRMGGTALSLYDFKRFVFPLDEQFESVEKTVYIGILPLITLFISFLFIIFKGITCELLFAMILLLVSIVIAFGLLPHDLIRSIPILGSNLWSRMTVLTAFSLSVIAAYVVAILFQQLDYGLAKTTLTVVVSISILFQVLDIKRVFAHFNGVVPQESFLVSTKTIDYVHESLLPLQSVLANHAFMIPGTLGSYDIPEWFSHGFRSPVEKATLSQIFLRDPFVTQTAAVIRCPDIKFESKDITYLGIRFIICSEPQMKDGLFFSRVLETSGRVRKLSLPILPQEPLIQYFTLNDTIETDLISLLIGTHGRSTSHSDLSLSLYNGKELIIRTRVGANKISENKWIRFDLGRTLRLTPSDYKLILETHSDGASDKLSAWLYLLNNKKVYLQQGSERIDGVLAARMYLKRNNDVLDRFKLRELEDGIYIYENLKLKGGAYFVNKLYGEPVPLYDNVRLLKHSLENVELQYTGDNNGWLVLPTRFYPGWNAYVNGILVDQAKFMNILPAIPVGAGDKVKYRYEAYNLKYTALISLIVLLFLLYQIKKLNRRPR